LIGTLLVLPLAELARGWLGDMGSGVHGLVYGIVLVVVVLTIPQGLVGRFGARVFGWIDALPGGRRPVVPTTRVVESQVPEPQTVKRGEPILVAENLHKFFGGLHATNDVSLSLA
jgi:branched-chain amino acid transport system permease protein